MYQICIPHSVCRDRWTHPHFKAMVGGLRFAAHGRLGGMTGSPDSYICADLIELASRLHGASFSREL